MFEEEAKREYYNMYNPPRNIIILNFFRLNFVNRLEPSEESTKGHKHKPFTKVLVRNTLNDRWRAGILVDIDNDYFVCMYGRWKQCIPYEGNEGLWRSY